MPRLIDADALKQQFRHPIDYSDVYVRRMIDAAHTIDPERHGRWVPNTDDYTPAKRCSACGYNMPIIAGENAEQIPSCYCPSCGARMDGGDTNG